MKKTAKRLCAVIICLLLCATAALTAAASSEPIVVEECDSLQLTLPDNMTAVTRSAKENDNYFANHQLDYNEVMRSFEEKDIYLQATDNIDKIIVTLTYRETDLSHQMDNYNKFTDADLQRIKNNYLITSNGDITYNAGTVDEAGKNVVWMFFDFTAENQRQYRAETVYNGKIVTLTLMRNDEDVQPLDYEILSGIAGSVTFPKTSGEKDNRMMLYIAIGAAALAVVLVIVLIAVAKSSKRRRQATDNEKILKELSGKYQTRRAATPSYSEDVSAAPKAAPRRQLADEEQYAPAPRHQAAYEDDLSEEAYSDGRDEYVENDDLYDDVPGRKYSDADIERLLGDWEDDGNFNDALPATEADFADDAEVRDSVINEAEAIYGSYEDVPEGIAAGYAAEQAASAYPEDDTAPEADTEAPVGEEVFDDPFEEPLDEELEAPVGEEVFDDPFEEPLDEAYFEEAVEDEPSEETYPEAPVEETPVEEAPTEEETAAEVSGEETADEGSAEDDSDSVDESQDDGDGEGESDDEAEQGDNGDPEEEADEEFQEFVNDEVLAREESNQEKFKKSSDFFEEAPKKVMGVISSKEIEEAEEYDVIGEVEQRAEALEAKPKPKGEGFAGVMKKVGAGLKSFGIHCGYFATNVKRSVKRKRAIKKRKKAEEERRRRQIERRAQERAVRERQRDKNGLVQVHRRDDRRPPDDRR